MDRAILRAFWGCGDNYIIEFALLRARLNRQEKDVVTMMLDECMTQEQVAEKMDLSVRHVQTIWSSASGKLLSIPWVVSYGRELKG